MTLCKYRPQRTYDAQFIFEQNDVNGLLKKLREAVKTRKSDRDDIYDDYYTGALIAFEIMFREAESSGEVDKWTDFMEMFGTAIYSEGGE